MAAVSAGWYCEYCFQQYLDESEAELCNWQDCQDRD